MLQARPLGVSGVATPASITLSTTAVADGAQALDREEHERHEGDCPMKDRLVARLEELKKEYESGRAMLAELEGKEANLRSTMLRIAGAIQVLEELVAQDGAGASRAKSPEA
jgi:predicted nuclease with TOPRIM domain